MAPTLEPLSPIWWVYKLHRKLVDRQIVNEKLQRYYSGDFDVPWLAPQAREEFKQVVDLAKANICRLVVDSTTQRLAVEGFRLGPDEQDADAETWRIWQANDLDATFDQGILETMICGTSYLLVGPNAGDERTPHVWVEHPSQAIVSFVAGTNRRQRAAGLKIWQDEWTGRLHSTLYLPTRIFRWESEGRASVGRPEAMRWAPRLLDGVSEDSNPLGKVPLYEVANRPRLLTGGVSELADVMVIQDRINKTLVDRLLTQDYGAFPQKNVSGWPTLDEQGNPVPQIEIGRNRLVSTSALGVEFGQWDAAPLDPYSAAKREDMRDAAMGTQTPAQYLLGDMSNVNGETLKASESGLVSKCLQTQRFMSDSLEDGMRGARQLAGLTGPGDADMETIWRDPQYRTEGERADATVKKVQAGIISMRQAREDLGYSQTQIARMEADIANEAVDATVERILRAPIVA